MNGSEVLGVDDAPAGPLAVHVRTRRRPACGGCGGAVWSKGSAPVARDAEAMSTLEIVAPANRADTDLGDP